MLRRLITPRWLGALVLAVLFAVASYHLGFWQYHRYEAKVERNTLLDDHYAADPVALDTVLTSEPVPPSREWTRVEVTGEYVGGPLLVRGRPNNSVVGFEELAVLAPDDGGTPVLVNRGWVAPSDSGASVLPQVDPLPTGTVTVLGWVRPSESSRGDVAPGAEQIRSVSVADAATALDTTLRPGVVRMEEEALPDGSAPPRPEPLEPPDRSLGVNLAYAYQWWMFMGLGFLLVVLGVRREERLANPDRYPPKAKKVRIWDEEDE